MKKLFVFLAVVAFTAAQVSNVNATEHKGKPKTHQTVNKTDNSKVAKTTLSNAATTHPTKSPSGKSNKAATTNTTKKDSKCEKNHSCCKSHNEKANAEKKGK